MLTLRNGPQSVADPPGREPDEGEGAEEAGEQVEEDRLRCAGPPRSRGRRRRPCRAPPPGRLRSAPRVASLARRALLATRRRRSIRPNWSDEHRPEPASATAARPTVARSERAHPNRVRARARRLILVGVEVTPAELPATPTGGLLLLGDDRLDRGDGAVGELDLDHEGADFAQRLLEPHFAFVDPQVAGVAQRVDDLLRRRPSRTACRPRRRAGGS